MKIPSLFRWRQDPLRQAAAQIEDETISGSSGVTRRSGLRPALDLLTTVILLASGISVLLGAWPPQLARSRPRPGGPVPAEPVSLDGAWLVGTETAPVVVVVFSDYECPACRTAARTILPVIDREFVSSGKIRLAYKHLPLSRIHPMATLAAVAAECAGAQGRFWEMHESLLGDDSPIDLASLRARGRALDLSMPEFDSCLGSDSVESQVKRQGEAARQMQISSTPTFIVGVLEGAGSVRAIRRIDGARKVDALRSAIVEVMAASDGWKGGTR